MNENCRKKPNKSDCVWSPILIKNQVLFASPSIEDVRSHVFNQLYEYTSVLTGLKRIEHSRYQVTMSAAHSDFKSTYQNLLTYSTYTVQLMEYTVASIDDLLNQVTGETLVFNCYAKSTLNRLPW